MRFLLLLFFSISSSIASANDYALDDAHNHDGTHVEGQSDCGGNYMLPGETARLGSHSFLILGADGPNHLLLDHRSGTPPHTYQFILRVRTDDSEMATYRKLLSETKVALPAVTTIYFDKSGKQVDRTFFCLHNLPEIFGSEQKPDDAFSKLFPIRASWQKDADFEGAFPIKETVVAEDPFAIERKDVELVLFRYLPSYLEQTAFRKVLKEKGSKFTSNLSHAPIAHDEKTETAATRRSFIKAGAFESNGETCRADYYLKSVNPPKTKHAFLLLAEAGKSSILAATLYDQSPRNYQTTAVFDVTDSEMKMFREARAKSKTPLLFLPEKFFCMSEVRELAKAGIEFRGAVYGGNDYREFQLGEKVGDLSVPSGKTKILVSRTLQSLMNPQAVARDAFGFVDVKTVVKDAFVETPYSTGWNFTGGPVNGYQAGRCYLTKKAATALAQVQREVSKQGYSLLVFDCFRPQRAVDQFVAWVGGKSPGPSEERLRMAFYPDEPRAELIKRGYIDAKSGHSRGSTIDLTLVETKKFNVGTYREVIRTISDCRKSGDVVKAGLLDMGTTFDCFSDLAQTWNKKVTPEVLKNRQILKVAMEKNGFTNYPKEWWHYTLREEPYKKDFFDLEVQ